MQDAKNMPDGSSAQIKYQNDTDNKLGYGVFAIGGVGSILSHEAEKYARRNDLEYNKLETAKQKSTTSEEVKSSFIYEKRLGIRRFV